MAVTNINNAWKTDLYPLIDRVFEVECRNRLATLRTIVSEEDTRNATFRMEGLECTLRQGDQGEFLFLLNHTDEAVSLPAEEGWRSALPDQGDVIPPYGAFVYTRA